jgi:hypothetical protein
MRDKGIQKSWEEKRGSRGKNERCRKTKRDKGIRKLR